MARHSEVLIQGNDVPGLRMIVTVPVDHTWASETAKSIYGFGGNTQYIWRKSWETNQPASRGSSSASSGGAGALGGLLLLLIPVGLIGAVVGGGSGEPTYTPSAPAPVTRTYEAPTSTPTPAWDNGPCVTANFEPC